MRASRTRTLTILVPVAVASAVGGSVATATAEAPTDPTALVAKAASNLKKVRSLHVESTTVGPTTGTTRVRADILRSGDADVRISLNAKAGSIRVVSISSQTYLRGDVDYWTGASGKGDPAIARRLANRWFKLSGKDAEGIRAGFTDLAPKRLAACLVAPGAFGTLSLGPRGNVGKSKAQIVVDAGDAPGTAPGKIFVSTGSKPLPLLVQQTGPNSPGAAKTACTNPADTSTSDELRFSKFNSRFSIRAPKGAERLPSR